MDYIVDNSRYVIGYNHNKEEVDNFSDIDYQWAIFNLREDFKEAEEADDIELPMFSTPLKDDKLDSISGESFNI